MSYSLASRGGSHTSRGSRSRRALGVGSEIVDISNASSEEDERIQYDDALEEQRLTAIGETGIRVYEGSAADEYEGSEDGESETDLPFFKTRKGKVLTIGILLIALIGVVTAIAFVASNESNVQKSLSGVNLTPGSSPSENPTQVPTVAPPSGTLSPSLTPTIMPTLAPISQIPAVNPREELFKILVNSLTSSGVSSVNSFVTPDGEQTPQILALNWLLDDNPLLLMDSSTSIPKVRLYQRYILATLFYSTDGERWNNRTSWLGSEHECTWFGLSCEEKNVPSESILSKDITSPNEEPTTKELMVVSIDLELNNIVGELPDEIFFLTNCTVLSLFGNGLSGTLSTNVGKMVALNKLWLEDNEFSGSLPSEIGLLAALDDLSIYENPIEGTLPTELGQLTRLERLWANNMRITGRIPTEFGMLSKLENLYLDVNFLSGSIPTELGLATNLRDLRLFRNGLGGTLPIHMFSLTKLEIVYLDTNKFKGEIPNEIGGLLSIKDLQLFTNDLTGSVPFEISLLQNLQILRLNDNDLTGNIPALLGTNENLLRVTLSDNRLVGTIPDSLQYSSSIRRIEFDRNSLEGTLPEWIGNLDELLTLNVANNRLTGVIPTSLSALKQLEEVKFEQNDFSGKVPREWCELESLSNGILTADCSGILPEVECSCCTSCFEIMAESRIGGH